MISTPILSSSCVAFVVVVAICVVASVTVSAFTPEVVSTKLLPTFDKSTQQWSPSSDNPEEPYGIGRTLLGNGPVPAFTRLTQSDDYLQAVYKFQASEKCTVQYAQGNMDAYFENPNDWAYQRSVELNGGYQKKYGEPIPQKQVLLTVTWGIGITAAIVNFVSTVVCCGVVLITICGILLSSSLLLFHVISGRKRKRHCKINNEASNPTMSSLLIQSIILLCFLPLPLPYFCFWLSLLLLRNNRSPVVFVRALVIAICNFVKYSLKKVPVCNGNKYIIHLEKYRNCTKEHAPYRSRPKQVKLVRKILHTIANIL